LRVCFFATVGLSESLNSLCWCSCIAALSIHNTNNGVNCAELTTQHNYEVSAAHSLFTSSIKNNFSPAGTFQFTDTPAQKPMRAVPNGDSTDIFFSFQLAWSGVTIIISSRAFVAFREATDFHPSAGLFLAPVAVHWLIDGLQHCAHAPCAGDTI